MKSKLFLSLSLLTAVFSISANVPSVHVAYVDPIFGQSASTSSVIGHMPTKAHRTFAAYNLRAGNALANGIETVAANPRLYAKTAGMLAIPVAGTVIGLAAREYMQPKQEVKLTRFERAKLALNNGYTTVKTNAMSGYNSSLKFVKANPKSTAGAVAAVAALGLVAYKYSDSIFGKSKVVTAPEAPKAPVRVAHVRALRD